MIFNFKVRSEVPCSAIYIYTSVPEPSKMTANYEKCVMANCLSKTLLNTNRK